MRQRIFYLSLLLPLSSLANDNAHYNEEVGLLSVTAKAFGQYWFAEFKNLDQQHFTLQSIRSHNPAIPPTAEFNAETGILFLPTVHALGGNWQATLQQTTPGHFDLIKLQALTAPVPDPAQRFSMHADGTVTDLETGLQWQRCSVGQTWNGSHCSGNHLKLSMQDAVYVAFNSQFAGKSDWRLPTIDELKSLIYCDSGQPSYWNSSGYRCQGNYQSPTLYQAAFPDSAAVYWSSSPLQADPGEDNTLTVSFNHGHVYYSYFKGDFESARLVRGQSNIIPGPEVVGGYKETPCVTAICSTIPR